MPDLIDDLVQRWKQNPNPAATVALCEALRDSPRPPLVAQVGEAAAQRHAGDVTVLLSVARMYIESQRLADAQNVLVAAGKQSPGDPRIYRWLGEVLLRRGDAERAQKVLERSLQLGASDTETRLWLERARGLRPVQASGGQLAVAAEVAHSVDGRRAPADSEGPTAIQRKRDGGGLEPHSSRPPPAKPFDRGEPPTWAPPSRSRPAPPPSPPPLPSFADRKSVV